MRILCAIFAIFALFTAACTDGDYVVIDNGDKKIKINVELADDAAERSIGLMFRESLDGNTGMLFVYGREGKYSFWMKNTLIPLDMIWISEGMEIVDIRHAEPCKKDPCPSYSPQKEAMYVLEVGGNFTDENSINVGDKVSIKI